MSVSPIPLQRRSRPATHPAAQARGANIITVASGKGGVGKTWLSVSLAHALARAGRKALLFDGDLGLANVDIQLGLMPEVDLGQVVGGHIGLEGAITRYENGGFDIIAGRSGSGVLGNLNTARLGPLSNELRQLATRYDKVVLDLGAGVDQPVRVLSGSAGPKLVVTTDEPTSLTDAYAYIKVSHGRDKNADLRIVVNMASGHKAGKATYDKLLKACRSFLNISPPLAGVIRRDARVAEAIRRQSPLLTRHPNCDAARDIETLASKLGGA